MIETQTHKDARRMPKTMHEKGLCALLNGLQWYLTGVQETPWRASTDRRLSGPIQDILNGIEGLIHANTDRLDRDALKRELEHLTAMFKS